MDLFFFFFFSSRRRHTRFDCDWSSDVCSSDLDAQRNFRKLLRKLNGIETTLATESVGYSINTPLLVQVKVVDGQIEVRIDNALLFGGPVGDGAPAVGSVGLYCWGNPAAAFDNVRVSALSPPDQPPLVRILSPANHATFVPPANITLTAEANDPDGTVQIVDFLANDRLLGTATVRPYTFTWNNAGLGDYSVRVRAVDDLGAESFSSPIDISVNYPPDYLVVRNPNFTSPGIFQFRIDAPLGTPLTIETSPDLQQWSPIATVTNTASPFQFSHPAPTNQPRHFYRARRQ